MSTPRAWPGLRGRRGDCDTLSELMVAARRWSSQVLGLRGDVGIGKTALLDFLLERATCNGQGRYEDAFADRPHGELLATGKAVRKPTVETHVGLTAQEAHIARLAGEELTNAEIATQLYLSPRTMEWHLARCSPRSGSAPAVSCDVRCSVPDPAESADDNRRS